ncbi:hypothetical protein [Paludisphaera rhizosphaerae]|uniref:hypothetical protein n=1 Tax=Paludisphaera rhizosphaerae TaxID=2711216 RepID=UPI0013ECE99A|nr:hypothetical protein [Paludisphaera rhizosphaerae]
MTKEFYIGTDRFNKKCNTVKSMDESLVGELRRIVDGVALGADTLGCFCEEAPKGSLIATFAIPACQAALAAAGWVEIDRYEAMKRAAA